MKLTWNMWLWLVGNNSVLSWNQRTLVKGFNKLESILEECSVDLRIRLRGLQVNDRSAFVVTPLQSITMGEQNLEAIFGSAQQQAIYWLSYFFVKPSSVRLACSLGQKSPNDFEMKVDFDSAKNVIWSCPTYLTWELPVLFQNTNSYKLELTLPAGRNPCFSSKK